eukprot:7723100-Pyramimonas_sp.AAC.1
MCCAQNTALHSNEANICSKQQHNERYHSVARHARGATRGAARELRDADTGQRHRALSAAQ